MKSRQQGSGRFWLVVVTGFFALLPVPAEAHTPVKGLGEFANGFLHPLVTLPHVLVLGVLGIFLGQRQPLRLKAPATTLAVFAAAGLLATVTGVITKVYPPALIVVGLCVGTLVALALPLPSWTSLIVCALAALVVSLDSGVDGGTPGSAAAKILVGTWVSMVLFVFNVAFYVSLLPKLQWLQTGTRVVGSWIVAITLLMLAFFFRHQK